VSPGDGVDWYSGGNILQKVGMGTPAGWKAGFDGNVTEDKEKKILTTKEGKEMKMEQFSTTTVERESSGENCAMGKKKSRTTPTKGEIEQEFEGEINYGGRSTPRRTKRPP